MKKFVAGSIGAVLMGAGLVASAGTPAQADPYPGTFATTTTVSAPAKVKVHKSADVCATVTPTKGSGAPTGTVTITVTRTGGNYRQSATFPYAGGQVCLHTKPLNKTGAYLATA